MCGGEKIFADEKNIMVCYEPTGNRKIDFKYTRQLAQLQHTLATHRRLWNERG